MNLNGSRAVLPVATRPIFAPHEHPVRQVYFFRIGNDMYCMAKLRQAVSEPIRPHAHSAFDRRIFSEDADFHGCPSVANIEIPYMSRPLSRPPHAQGGSAPCDLQKRIAEWTRRPFRTRKNSNHPHPNPLHL